MKQAQSYYSVIMHADFTIYQMRMLLIVVRRLRSLTSAIINKQLASSYCTDGVHLNFAVPIRMLVGNSHNYDSFKASMRSMIAERNVAVEHYDYELKVWRTAVLFDSVELHEKEGVLHFSVNKWIIDYICDFSGGYRIYDFENAMSLRNPNSARLYLLCSSVNKPFYASFGELKKMLGVGSSYSRFSDFERRVLRPSAHELEVRGFNGFRYDVVRSIAGSKKSPVVGVRLFPVKRELKNISELKSEIVNNMPAELSSYLITNCGFSVHEVSANKATLMSFAGLNNWQEIFINIIDRARRKRKNHGYIINALKSELKSKL